MRLVDIHAPGWIPRLGEWISPHEREALVTHYLEGCRESVQPFLRRLASARLWIACECRAAPPLLFARRVQNDAYVLVRMADRPRHASSCPFERAPALPEAQDAVPALPPLAQLFFSWWDAASLNQLLPYEASDLVQAQYAALRVVSKSMMLAPGQGLFEFHRTHPQGLAAMLERLRTVALRAPVGTAALYLCIRDDLDREALADSLNMSVPQSPFPLTRWELPTVMLLSRAARDEGPYVVLLRLMAAPGGRMLQIETAFAHPIYSRRLLVPLDGARDRYTLRLLLDVQRELASAKDLLRIRVLLPGTAAHDRGISFAVERLGPNGRTARTAAIVAAMSATPAGVEVCPDTQTLYHRIASAATTEWDQTFKRELTRRMRGAQVLSDSTLEMEADGADASAVSRATRSAIVEGPPFGRPPRTGGDSYI